MFVPHTVTAFDAELGELKQLIRSMGGLAAKQVRAAIAALAGGRREEARGIILQDKAIDEMQRQIEAQAVCLIVKRQPLAIDLREAISAIRLAINIERIGDLGTNIAKRTVDLHAVACFAETISDVLSLGEVSLRMLASSMEAIAQRDSRSLLATWRAWKAAPDPYNATIEKLAKAMLAAPTDISAGTHLLFCIRNVEHVEVHAEDVARIVYAAIEGRPLSSVADDDASVDNAMMAPLAPLMIADPFSSHIGMHGGRDLHEIK